MDRVIFTFPGQGAQVPGMLHALAGQIPCDGWYAKASDALGEDVLALDTPEALETTRAVQLCILIAGVACADWLAKQGAKPDFVSGLSIGAFPAAVVSGVLGFEDAVRLVSLRGDLMQSAWPEGYGLSAISGVTETPLVKLVDSVNAPDMPVYMANFNASDQFVIAGSETAMQKVMQLAREQYSARAERLKVAVPSHCPLLDGPAAVFEKAVNAVPMKRPKTAYLSGSTGRVLWQPERIADDIANNMARPVQWFNAMTAAYERGARLAVEMPPGSVLTGLFSRVMEQGETVAVQQQGIEAVLQLILRLKRR